jgi:exopolyphosphatase / guanosine-5'-triphosphate,3'-diphosphate pyrophosphatase
MSSLSPDDKSPNTPSLQTRQIAVIDIGTASIRLAIGEIAPDGTVHTKDTLTQAVKLGRDTFTRGSISRATMEDCVRVLKSYQRVLKEYNVTSSDQIRVIGSSAVREASNHLAFIDRVYIATGLEVEPLDEAVVSRVTYLGMQRHLEQRRNEADLRTLIVEVGGGTTELLAVKAGDVIFSHVYRLGSLRLRKTLEEYRAPTVKLRNIMETQILRTIDEILEHVSVAEGPLELIAMGGDMRFAIHEFMEDWDTHNLAKLSVAQLQKITDRVLGMTDDQLVRKYDLTFPEAESLGPALLANLLFAQSLRLKDVYVTNSTLRDGLLQEMAIRTSWTADFSRQIIRSAVDLGKRYSFDEPHALHVAQLSQNLFQQLRSEHHLDARFAIILYVAALLHEIGMFVGTRSHHKHAMYLIRNSELFGLGRKEHLLAALVARYHRRSSPQPTHEGYETLDRQDRVAVTQLAALLRVAIALDDSRSQRIHEFDCTIEEGRLIISVPLLEDLSLEQLALRQNGVLFEETFGMPVLLRMQS